MYSSDDYIKIVELSCQNLQGGRLVSKQVNIRISAEEYYLLAGAARRANKPLSTYARTGIVEKAKRDRRRYRHRQAAQTDWPASNALDKAKELLADQSLKAELGVYL
jgi:uncharacterized protein (DUF1778 family)